MNFIYIATVPCRFQRPPGPIPSSMLGLEAFTGNLDHFGFEDYLNGDMNCLYLFICIVGSVYYMLYFPSFLLN